MCICTFPETIKIVLLLISHRLSCFYTFWFFSFFQSDLCFFVCVNFIYLVLVCFWFFCEITHWNHHQQKRGIMRQNFHFQLNLDRRWWLVVRATDWHHPSNLAAYSLHLDERKSSTWRSVQWSLCCRQGNSFCEEKECFFKFFLR